MENIQALGRPPRYTTPEEMQKAIDAYFNYCTGEWLLDSNGRFILDANGRPTRVNTHPATIAGLALFLGFSTRKSLLDYQRKPMFRDTVTLAKARVEQAAEESLFISDRYPGAKFYLLYCCGWARNTPEERNRDSVQVRFVNAR